MVPMCCGGVAGYGTHVLWWSSWLWYPCVRVESIAGLYGVQGWVLHYLREGVSSGGGGGGTCSDDSNRGLTELHTNVGHHKECIILCHAVKLAFLLR